MQTQDNSFVLKHRIVGAAILILFGVLFLPWLLGSPKYATLDPSVWEPKTSNTSSKQINNNKLGNTKQGQTKVNDSEIEEQIQVYVSKITPLIDPVNVNAKISEEKANKQETKPLTSKDKPVVKPSKSEQTVQNTAKQNEVKKSVVKQEVVTKPKDNKPTVKKNIKLGWIVSVGVFAKQGNVDAIMADLKNKGLNPSASKTETSKGLGTRVWLGPYEQRVDAAKARAKLKELIGEPGAIIAYP